jgi:Amt family ammonium transporter
MSAFAPDPLWGTGVIDFAGTGVVHLTGGVTALVAAKILGPRRGRFHDDDGKPLDVPREFPGHSIALQMLGVFILWFGWYGFNAGSALTFEGDPATIGQVAALAATNTTLSGGTAGITALFFNMIIQERMTGEPFFDLKFAMNGTLLGLVSITGGCGVVEPWAAVVIGFIAGLLYILGTHLLIRLRIDDAVDAVPCHMFGGLWGLLSVGLFASPSKLLAAYGRDKHVGWFYSWGRGSGDFTLMAAQICAVLWITGWVLAIMFPFFVWLDWKGWFRSDPLEEIVGLDMSYHGGTVLADSSVNPEYIAAFNQRKGKDGGGRRTSDISSGHMLTDHQNSTEMDDEEHAG